jgi:acylphosphatase
VTQPNESVSQMACVVFGRVQGVGFRWWARRTAERLGIRGSIRNLPDGSVEVQAAGSSTALRAFRESLRVGPPGARVDGLRPIPPTSLPAPNFRIVT